MNIDINNLQNGVPQGMSQGMPQGMPQGIAQGMPQGMPQGIAQGMPHGIPQGIAQGMPQGIAQGMPQMPNNNQLENIKNSLPKEFSGEIPLELQNNLPSIQNFHFGGSKKKKY